MVLLSFVFKLWGANIVFSLGVIPCVVGLLAVVVSSFVVLFVGYVIMFVIVFVIALDVWSVLGCGVRLSSVKISFLSFSVVVVLSSCVSCAVVCCRCV